MTPLYFIALELLENLEEMFPRYYVHSDIFSMFTNVLSIARGLIMTDVLSMSSVIVFHN